jgi:hypothetical protein
MSIRTPAWIRLSRFLFLFFLIALATGGCSSLKIGGAGEKGAEIWKFGDQFVRLEPQGGPTPLIPNSQPANLAPDKLRQILGALEVKFPDRKEPVPVFSDPELKVLGTAVSTGLAEAGPDQDVDFAVIGMHPGSITLERRLVTGRFFVRDGKLNLIFGNMQTWVDENEDRRLNPFVPGSRQATAPPPWRVQTMAGVENYSQGDTTRLDWLVLDPERKQWPAAGTGTKNPKEVSAALKAAEEARTETEALKVQQKKLQEEVSGIRKDLSENAAQAPSPPTPAQAASPPAATQAASPSKNPGNIQSRLRLLQQLRQENLITEKEYQEKKRQILDEL